MLIILKIGAAGRASRVPIFPAKAALVETDDIWSLKYLGGEEGGGV